MSVQDEVCRPRVVVVDDEVDFLKLTQRWLSPKYAVTCLTGGEEASGDIASLDPDLLIIDIHMPERSGFEICRQLRAQAGFEDLPIIFLTGSKADKDFVRSLDFGGSRYLVKPISGKELNEAVAEQLGLRMVG